MGSFRRWGRWAVMALIGFLPVACGGEPQNRSEGTASTANAEDVVYVDVRSPAEYAAEHVEGAINIPHTEIRERHEELEPYADRQIVLYCRTGRRSGIAKGILEEEGFTGLENAGGLADLRAQGVPTTR